jgi:hypothetical protein
VRVREQEVRVREQEVRVREQEVRVREGWAAGEWAAAEVLAREEASVV